MAASDDTYLEGFEWDETKRRRNLAKHGVDFVRSARVFDGRIVQWDDKRKDYGEERKLVLGQVNDTVLFLVYTWRNGKRRLISARKANPDERKAYHAGIPPRPRQA